MSRKRSQALTLPKLLQRLLGQHNVLTVSKELIIWLDHDIPAALLVSQLVYWSERGDDPDGWIYKTYQEWRDEIALSEYQVRRSTNKLKGKDCGFVETKLKKVNGAPTVHYKIDLTKFSEWILEKLQIPDETTFRNDPEETSDSLTETTPKTTQKDIHSMTLDERIAYQEELERDLAWIRSVKGTRG